MPSFYDNIVEVIDRGRPVVVALVVSAQGSTPQRVGARAILDGSGLLCGTIGGGMVEAQAIRLAREACLTGKPRVFDCKMTNLDAAVEAAVCGGTMRVLVDPTVARHRACFADASRALAERRRGCLVTEIGVVGDLEVKVRWLANAADAAAIVFPGSEAIQSCLESGSPRRFVAASTTAETVDEVFVEPVVPPPRLVIAGGGHVGRAVALEAARVGFEVLLIDDRPEFADAANFPPEIQVKCGPVADEIAACPLDADSFVVLVTRGHRHDAVALAQCIRQPLAYLGMIGSRRKVAFVRKNFLEKGMATAEEFDRVHAPIGLQIGAVTVPEIAVSIVAQLIAVRRKASPG